MNQREKDFQAKVKARLVRWYTLPADQKPQAMLDMFTRAERCHMQSYGRRRSTFAHAAWR